MSFDFEPDDDFFEPDNDQFYRGYVSPADEWSVNHRSLFNELNGSIFNATAKLNKRLKRLNEVIAFSESRETKNVNKKNRIAESYNFMTQYIPNITFDKITEILSFTEKDKKKIARDIGLNLDTLANIISLWQLELYTTGNFVPESVLDEINVFLKESSSFGQLKSRGHITTKDIERAESRILRQLYSQLTHFDETKDEHKIFPHRVLSYYQDFINTIDQHLYDRHKTLLDKHGRVPFHAYLLAQKIDIFKRLLPKIALDYFKSFIEPDDLSLLETIIDQFYDDKSAMVGELIAQGIILLELFFNKQASLENIPTKFLTRVKKYRHELIPPFQKIFEECIETNASCGSNYAFAPENNS